MEGAGQKVAKSPLRAALGIGLLIAVVYGACHVLFIPHDGFWIVDSGCKFIQVEGLVRGGYGAYDIRWPGATVDPGLDWVPIPYPFGLKIGGKLFLQYSPLFAMLSSLPYKLMGFAGLYLLPCLAGLLLLPAIYGVARQAGAHHDVALLAVLLTGLAGPLWFYSLSFWEHTLAVALVGWAVWAGLRHLRTGAAAPLAAAALLCGLAIYLRDELYLLAGAWAAVLLALSPRRRTLWLFPCVAILTLAPLWWFQHAALGHPLGRHFAQAADTFSLTAYFADRVVVFRNLFLNVHPHPLWSVLLSGPLLVLWLWRPAASHAVNRGALGCGLFVFAAGLIILLGLAGSASPLRALLRANGLFAPAPLLALGFIRLEPAAEPGDRVRRALLLLITGYAAAYGLIAPPLSSQGIHWGCRFLLPLYPLLAVLAARVLASLWRSASGPAAMRFALAGAVGIAVLLQLYSVRLLAQRQSFTREVARALAARPERAFVTNDSSLMAEYLAPLFYDRLTFLVRHPDEAARLHDRLARAGIRDVAWITTAPPESVPEPGAFRLTDSRLNFLAVDVRSIHSEAP